MSQIDMKEYGGYIEFENYHGNMLHEDAVALNCGRGALAYLCAAKKIKKLYLPYFLGTSVSELCEKAGVKNSYYHIDEGFNPIFKQRLGEDEWLYIVNFYGQLDNNAIDTWKKKYGKIIVDNTQSYYQMPVEGVDTLYTCRKYFGVADGAFLYTDARLDREVPNDESFERMHFLLGRYERNANEFYNEYVANNNRLISTEPIKRMSRLTKNLLRGIDYEFVCQRRTENFTFLYEHLKEINHLTLSISHGAFMYPLYLENGARIRKDLQAKRIYIPTLWPNVLNNCPPDSLEYRYAENILPIPVDQRYGIKDMNYLVEMIKCASAEKICMKRHGGH